MAKMVLRSYAEENARRKRIRIVFIFVSIPLLAIILLYGAKTASMFYNAQSSISNFEEKKYSESAEAGDRQKAVNIIQSWLAYYNSGTARIANGDYPQGIEDLKIALKQAEESVPAECFIRANLAIGYERYGDTFKDREATDQALGFYALAEQTIAEANPACFPPQNSSSGNEQQDEAAESMNETSERLEEKKSESNGEEPQDGNGEQQQDETKSGEDKIREQTEETGRDRAEKEAQERGKENQSDDKMEGDTGGGEDGEGGEGSDGVKKPW
jgi:tetratricopeptide (TPR) repeat protein